MATVIIEPADVVKNIIESHYVIPGWTTVVNDGWFEVMRQEERQIYFLTTGALGARSKTEHIQRDMDRSTSPTIYKSLVYLVVAAPTRALREVMVEEMYDVFHDTTKTHQPEAGVDDVIILNDFPRDKDKKSNCVAWEQVFEIQVLW